MAQRPIPWTRLLAEGLVIIAGVLIALAADRYVQQIDDRRQESAYLQRLLAEFEEAEAALVEAADAAESRMQRAELLVAALEGPLPDSVSATDLVLGMTLSSWLWAPQIPRETWDDLISTGRVGLIQSDSLRSSVSEFYRLITAASELHAEWVTALQSIDGGFQAILSPRLLLAIAQYRLLGNPIDPDLIPRRAALISALRNQPRVREAVSSLLTLNFASEWQYRLLAERAREVIGELRSELDRGE